MDTSRPRSPHAPSVLSLLLLIGAVLHAPAGAAKVTDDLDLYGDARLRLESDFDSTRTDGTERDDRARIRVRARVGLDFRAGDRVAFGVRLRSGSDLSQQSPHVTVLDFDDNDTGDADFNLDKWFVKAGSGRVWGWAGRNGFPFWRQNEHFWDDDATVAGLAGGIDHELGEAGKLTANAAYLTPPVGLRDFAGYLAGVQLVYSRACERTSWTLAGGLFDYDAADLADDPDAGRLRNGNGLRDYRIWVGNFQVKLDAGGRPLALGADWLHNAESYSATDPDPFTAANRDETDGLVVSATWGGVKERGDWEAAYYFARIETLAVIASFAQDDWVRWGSDTETDSSDLRGHELRFTYGVSNRSNLMARLYLVEAITTVQDGSRFRLDFNFRF